MKDGYESIGDQPRSLEEKEEIEGILVAINPGSKSPILCIETEAGKITKIYAKTVLKSQILPCHIGREIYIKGLGEKKSAAGASYFDYEVGIKPMDQYDGKAPY